MFRPDVMGKLGFYVYRLVDPRDGRTFYVGKGIGNRVFSHASGFMPDQPGLLPPKLATIAEIKAAGLEVEHHIHRHGLDEQTAFHVEAALIDAYPELTNLVRGHRSDEFGTATTGELVARYQAEPAEWRHDMLLIGVSRTLGERSTYEAARFAWKLQRKFLPRIQFVLAVRDRVVVDVFRPARWLPATLDNFPDAEAPMPGRVGFEGERADVAVCLYVGRCLPEGCNLSHNGVRYVGPTLESSRRGAGGTRPRAVPVS